MGSQRAKVVRLSDSAPPPNYDALADELNNKESKDSKKPQRLNLVGSVKEKGFSTDTLSRHRISLPQPRVTPFPVARHRSDGPHWGPSSSKESFDPVIELNGDDGATGTEMAMPLNRRQPAHSLTGKLRSNRKSDLNISSQIQNAYDDTRQQSTPQATSIASIMELESPKLLGVVAEEKDLITKPMLMDDRSDMGRAYSKPAQKLTHSGPNVSTTRDIDAENRKTIFAMSPEEVDEAQAELSQKLRPELLDLLRKRGAEKERNRLAERVGTSVSAKVSEGSNRPVGFQGYKTEVEGEYFSSSAEDNQSVASIQKPVKRMSPSDQITSNFSEAVRGTKVGPADLLTTAPSFAQVETTSNHAAEESYPPPTTDPWTLRVEAVRSLRFDLNGSVVSMAPSPQSNDALQSNSAGVLHNTFSVVERDYLRTDGDPVGAGYSLKESLALVRSTVPGQRAFGLHVLASVLDNAIQGLQDQKFNPSSALLGEGVGGKIDWQAIWAYALGPEAELVLTLRLALDDGHSTVVAASARAIQALLSYSANEGYFESLEALWPGDKAVFTAPVFRRKTKHNVGFIGGGRWKYNVKTSEMFPFSDTTEKSEEDGKETVADDSHVSNKDVAAGLIRMGILPRIRYILEVDQLIAAEEALLSVLICLARHSPTAANAVMTCPRLVDALLQRFIGTDFCEESWSARLKAIRLLKVLSQARKANCVHFERIGALQTVMGPLLRQSYANDPSGHVRDESQGYYEVMIATVRFWRVCIDYGIGISLFSDCYSILCFWLLPLSKEEILSAVRDESLLLARESYLLLEHIARTLPLLHASGDLVTHVDGVNWSWSVAQAILHTAMQWLSPECISGVQMLLEPYVQECETQSRETIKIKTSTTRVLGIVASLLHFLATVCEKIVSEDQLHCALEDPDNVLVPWFPTFLPKLGLALARSGLLNYSQLDLQSDLPESTLQSDMSVSAMEQDFGAPTLVSKMPVSNLEKRVTFLECLHFCQTQADHDSALVAINCLNALVRVNSVVDILIYIGKPKATSPLEDQTPAHRILERGLLLSAERELRSSLDICEENVISRTDFLQMSERGGPAPGVGIGWGSLCGGTWSKEVIISQASDRLALDLMSVFSSRVWGSLSDNDRGKVIEEGEPSQQLPRGLSSRLNFCLSVIATSTVVNRELVLRACSGIIFHPSTLSILMQKIEDVLLSWRANRAQEEGLKVGRYLAEDKNLDQDYVSKILLKHCEDFWLAFKKKHKDGVSHKGSPKRKSNGFRPDLAIVDEESGEGHISHPESLMVEWVGQRLPLPSHWFLSPLVGDFLLATKKDGEYGADSVMKETAELEEVIKAGLVFFLGFEIFAANTSEAECINSKIPMVRKIHSLSTVFTSGSDVFLDPTARDLIGALQKLIGDQMEVESTIVSQDSTEGWTASENGLNGLNGHGYQATAVLQRDTISGDVMDKESIMPGLDFEGSIDANYLNYAEMIAEQFVATSFGDHVFARQVALHLCLDVPVMIRLAIWRVLTDGRVLELLPPLTQCAGPPQKYLYPIEANQQMLESFASSWSSGALDKAAKRNSLSFTLASHHLAGYLFDTSDTEETLLLKKKTARALVRSAVGKLDRQEMLLRLLHYVPAWSPSNGEQATEGAEIEQLKLRVSFLGKACEGDSSLVAEVQNLMKLVVSKVRGLHVGGV